jgi:hypothetical protein
MSKPNLYKFPGFFFEVLVPTLFQASFGKQHMELAYDTGTGVYTFYLMGKEFKSDSAEELVEIVIREIERIVTLMIEANLDQRPYCVFSLTCDEDGPPMDIYDAFAVLERPYRVELYTDTFRRGILKLHELRP